MRAIYKLSALFAFSIILYAFTRKEFTAKPLQVSAPAAVLPIPSDAQMAWHEMELNAFIHFTTNTFTGLEWGKGSESPAIFNPTQLDANQWVSVLKKAGFKQVILTCKHHDGFCLWPSQFTEHSIKNSPYKSGKGDLVKEVSDACKQQGIRFGVYLSPWDRNRADYGRPGYISYYRNQLKELFTRYGKVSEMWFDGANGGDGYYGGANEVRKINASSYYDWQNTLALVRSMQTSVLFFSDAGPDLRWCGNERGYAGLTNWNTIRNDTLHAGKSGIETLLNTGSEDGNKWIPSEVDVSIRPGWFYHQKEDSLVRSPENLFNIYLSSVGRGSTLLLNIPPNQRGLIHENDQKSLEGFRKLLNERFKNNFARQASISTSGFRGNSISYSPSNMNDNKKDSYWCTDDGIKNADIVVDLKKKHPVKYVLMQEYIKLGQRVKAFTIEAWVNNEWKTVADGTTIGFKRIFALENLETEKLRIRIKDAKACPLISNIEVY